ncbi:Na+-driven multidrug efflux pump [Fervidobacterium changbaicum]|uniref:MATE family efflux transporter n=2 Tax=Fervidobacterium TaxID=2422 RepID=A0AAI8CL62_FERIS|nr:MULTISPECIES: MATE family efflux transporter [Fervidobacterium]AMW32435.1 MATE family efflux transporter [Fervidobacterium islandicum]QAV33986.1 MATE family efflux transporter [Fervidobacterium changbaicum]SDH25782.1 Na+-driven multidrug efflux pump [Fervidobacterium changbaicum]
MSSTVKDILKIAIPVSVENLIANTGTFILTVFLSRMGEKQVTVNGIANQGSFLVILFLFGLNTGGAIFVSQYWGKKDREGIKRTSTLMIYSSLIIALGFFVLTFFFPEMFSSIFTKDKEVIAASVPFLKVISISYFGFALEIAFRTLLRGIELAIIPMESYVFGTALQIFLAYNLIHGLLGFPRLGLLGIAIATTVARFFIPVYQIIRASFLRVPYSFAFSHIDRNFVKKFFEFATPTTLNEISWSLGMTVYGIIFGRMGVSVYAARNILSSFENYVWTITFGLVIAASVMVGKMIGRLEYERVHKFSAKMLVTNSVTGLVSAVIIIVIYYSLLPTFKIDLATKRMLTATMWVMLVGAPIKSFNGAGIVGILRAGGDAKFAFLLETFTLWAIGIPLTLVGAFVLKLSLPWVYFLTLSDEIVKAIIVLLRIRGKKWIKNVTIEGKEGTESDIGLTIPEEHL